MDAVTLPVRSDDLDVNGHVRAPTYLIYADHARWAGVAAAGIDQSVFHAHGVGPVNLETTIRHLAELRAHHSVTVTSAFEWGNGKTSRLVQRLTRADGVVVAEVTSVSGLLDLATRRLMPDLAARWREMATAPELLGLS